MVSVIIPIYNSQLFLDKCIDSVSKQSYKDFECILVNDGSTDNSGEICNKWTKKDNRFKVFHQKNRGVSEARNLGLSKVKGEYVTFIDSDDYINESYINDLIINKDKKSQLVVTGIRNIYSFKTIDNKPSKKLLLTVSPKYTNEFIDLNKKNLLYGPCAKLYNTSIIKNHNLFFTSNLSYGEDLIFNFQYLEYVNQISIVSTSNYYYRRSSGISLSTKIYSNIFDINYNQWQLMKAFYLRKNMWNCISMKYMYIRLWGIVYDAIFQYPLLKIKDINYIKRILEIPEIENLKYWQRYFKTNNWIKFLILKRNSLAFYLYFTFKYKLK